MFQNLEPNKNYSISVTMRNGVGEGPPAVTYIMTTPEPAGTFHRELKLINLQMIIIQRRCKKRDVKDIILLVFQ